MLSRLQLFKIAQSCLQICSDTLLFSTDHTKIYKNIKTSMEGGTRAGAGGLAYKSLPCGRDALSIEGCTLPKEK
jgi:hypothetical protein